jgi:hypothetical protein
MNIILLIFLEHQIYNTRNSRSMNKLTVFYYFMLLCKFTLRIFKKFFIQYLIILFNVTWFAKIFMAHREQKGL